MRPKRRGGRFDDVIIDISLSLFIPSNRYVSRDDLYDALCKEGIETPKWGKIYIVSTPGSIWEGY
jgi:hypothetical protein